MSPPPKLCTAATLPMAVAGLVAHREPDQVGVVELVLLQARRQSGAVDEKLGAGQRLGGAAVADALEADDDDGSLRPDGAISNDRPSAGEERSVVGERQRIAGEGS